MCVVITPDFVFLPPHEVNSLLKEQQISLLEPSMKGGLDERGVS